MTHRMHSLGRWFAWPAVITAAAVWSGCVADAREADAPEAPADEAPPIAAARGTLLASVPFDGEGAIDFVEIEPGTVVAQGSWNADEASSMGDAVRQLPL